MTLKSLLDSLHPLQPKPKKDDPPPPPPEPPKRVRHGKGVYKEGDYVFDGEFHEDVIQVRPVEFRMW